MNTKLLSFSSTAALIAGLSGGAAFAGALDRSGQKVDLLFEEGNVIELSFGRVSPTLEGENHKNFSYTYDGHKGPIDNIAKDYIQYGLGIKYQVNEKFSYLISFDQPFGIDTAYGPDPENVITALAYSFSDIETHARTFVGRYEFGNGFSVHGGIRSQSAGGEVYLEGIYFVTPYSATFDRDQAFGYVAGAAFEKPEIALRAAITYNSSIDHKLDTIESAPIAAGALGGDWINRRSVTEVSTPESVNNPSYG